MTPPKWLSFREAGVKLQTGASKAQHCRNLSLATIKSEISYACRATERIILDEISITVSKLNNSERKTEISEKQPKSRRYNVASKHKRSK